MSFLLTSLQQALTARLTSWRTWLLLVLLPLTALGTVRLLPPEETAAPVRVGVVLPEEGGEEFWQKLQAHSGLVVTFLPSDRSRAERQVSLGRWDCALVLPEDFAGRLARRETSELFTLLIGPGSAAYPMVRETAAACAAECLSPGMAEDCLLDSGIADGARLEAVRPLLQKVLGEQDRVRVTMETADGAPLDPLTLADSGVSRLIAGLTAVLLLIWALLTAMDLGRWLDSPFARRLLPLRGMTALLLPRLAAALIPALCAGSLALLAAGAPPAFVWPLIPYLLFWGEAALVLARIRPVWRALPALLPFIPVLGLLLSPVLLDPSLLFPALGPVIRWMPVTLYLNACGGQWGDVLLLLGGALLLLGLSLAQDRNSGW